jgi:hypothetical protein
METPGAQLRRTKVELILEGRETGEHVQEVAREELLIGDLMNMDSQVK